jgi:hypothetical protein
VPELADVDTESARAIVGDVLAAGVDVRSDEAATVPLVGSALADLLGAYGIHLWPMLPATSEDEAVAGADELGWPVALKTIDPRYGRRADFSGVRLHLENEQSLRAAFLSLAANLDETALSQIVVQHQATPGTDVVLRKLEDPLFGPVISFGLGGAIPELLADRAYHLPPISDADAARLVRGTGSSNILFGYGGRQPVDIEALEDLVVRLGRLSDELPQMARLDLSPVIVSVRGLAVLGASAWLRSADLRGDAEARRLTRM